MDRQVKLWFIQRLIKLWIKEKGADKCVLMQDALSEKFSGIDANGFVWWDAFKHVENPSALMSDKAFRDYMDGVYEQMAQLIPYLYVQLEKEYEQLEQELYMILEKKAMYSTPMLDMQEATIRRKMYFYEVAGSWRYQYVEPWFGIKEYKGKLWFRYIE